MEYVLPASPNPKWEAHGSENNADAPCGTRSEVWGCIWVLQKSLQSIGKRKQHRTWMERCVGKEKVSRNKPGGVWATAKETSSLDRLARGTVASPASTSPGKRDRIQSHDTKLAVASMQDPGKAPVGFWKKFPPRWGQASATTKRGEMKGFNDWEAFQNPHMGDNEDAAILEAGKTQLP